MSISIIVNQMIILFILIGTGYLLNKVHILGGQVDKQITRLILFCTMPMMVLNSVLSNTGKRDYGSIITFSIISVIGYLALPVLAFIFVKLIRVKKGLQGLYMFMFIFGNVGFMGFPVVSALFGEDKVIYAGVVNIVFNLLAYSYGVYIMSLDGEGEETVKISFKTFLTPGISISAISLVLYFTGVNFPQVIKAPVAYLANTTTPLAMLVIGSTLAGISMKEVFTDKKVYIFVALRFFVFPLLIYPLMKLLIKDEFILHFSFIMLIMPVANSSVLYAKQYGSDEDMAAKAVFMSTLLSIVTIPLLFLICL
ncbi:MAG: AEC family transporter [Lachnospiraceae bacterium]|nr:AEC family transporter [Lachnospiraceae bacterium]